MLLVYVDDMIVMGRNQTILNHFIHRLGREFAMKDLTFLHDLLGIEFT